MGSFHEVRPVVSGDETKSPFRRFAEVNGLPTIFFGRDFLDPKIRGTSMEQAQKDEGENERAPSDAL